MTKKIILVSSLLLLFLLVVGTASATVTNPAGNLNASDKSIACNQVNYTIANFTLYNSSSEATTNLTYVSFEISQEAGLFTTGDITDINIFNESGGVNVGHLSSPAVGTVTIPINGGIGVEIYNTTFNITVSTSSTWVTPDKVKITFPTSTNTFQLESGTVTPSTTVISLLNASTTLSITNPAGAINASNHTIRKNQNYFEIANFTLYNDTAGTTNLKYVRFNIIGLSSLSTKITGIDVFNTNTDVRVGHLESPTPGRVQILPLSGATIIDMINNTTFNITINTSSGWNEPDSVELVFTAADDTFELEAGSVMPGASNTSDLTADNAVPSVTKIEYTPVAVNNSTNLVCNVTFNEGVKNATIDLINSADTSLISSKAMNRSSADGLNWTYNFSTFEKNCYVNVSINATDLAGNLNGSIKYDNAFIFDNSTPQITVSSPAVHDSNKNYIEFNFSISDVFYNTSHAGDYTIAVDGTQVNASSYSNGTDVKYTTSSLSAGNHTWVINATDDAKNKDSVNGYIRLNNNTNGPTINIVNPANATYFNGTNEFKYLIQFNDTVSYSQNLNMTITTNVSYTNASNVSSGSNIYDVNRTNWLNWQNKTVNNTDDLKDLIQDMTDEALDGTDGTYMWNVTAIDKAGNSNTSISRLFYVDANAPTVKINSPIGGVYISTSGTFNFTVNDSNSGLPFTYNISINGTDVKNGTVTVTNVSDYTIAVPVTGISLGNHNWSVNITDSVGHTGSNSSTFNVDNIPPTVVGNLTVVDVNSTILPGGYDYSLYNKPELNASWEKSTDDQGLATQPYEIFVSQTNTSRGDSVGSTGETYYLINTTKYSSLTYGTSYYVTVVTSDKAGNNNTSTTFGPIQTYEDMNMTLASGWNFKSVPKTLLTKNIEAQQVFGENSTVLYWDGSKNDWDILSNTDHIDSCKGYWVWNNESANVSSKICFDPDVRSIPELSLTAGWQTIGQTNTNATLYNETLNSLVNGQGYTKYSQLVVYSNGNWGGIIVGKNIFGIADTSVTPIEWLEDPSHVLVPGQGYWIHMDESGSYASIEKSTIKAQDREIY